MSRGPSRLVFAADRPRKTIRPATPPGAGFIELSACPTGAVTSGAHQSTRVRTRSGCTMSQSAGPVKGRIPVWNWTGAVVATKVKPPTKLVCLAIARYLSDAGKGWRISVADLMRDTGLSNRSVATHLELAHKAGLLAIERNIGRNGRREVTTYAARFPDGVTLATGPAELPSEGPSPRRPREGASPQVPLQGEDHREESPRGDSTSVKKNRRPLRLRTTSVAGGAQ